MAAKRNIERLQEAREEILRTNRTDMLFTMEQVEDICHLIHEHRWPNGEYGDSECLLWSLMCRTLGEEPLSW